MKCVPSRRRGARAERLATFVTVSAASPSASPSKMASVKRPDDVTTIRFLSSVLSSLNHKVVQQAPLWSLSWRAPTPSRDDSDPELQFFNHLATMFDTGSYGGLAIAVTGKYDEEGPMVTIVVSRNSSRSDMKPEPNHCQPDAL